MWRNPSKESAGGDQGRIAIPRVPSARPRPGHLSTILRQDGYPNDLNLDKQHGVWGHKSATGGCSCRARSAPPIAGKAEDRRLTEPDLRRVGAPSTSARTAPRWRSGKGRAARGCAQPGTREQNAKEQNAKREKALHKVVRRQRRRGRPVKGERGNAGLWRYIPGLDAAVAWRIAAAINWWHHPRNPEGPAAVSIYGHTRRRVPLTLAAVARREVGLVMPGGHVPTRGSRWRMWAVPILAAATLMGGALSPAARAASTPRPTNVRVFVPATFSATAVETGYCWTGSIASNRPDAFRCMSGNAIMDPCFAFGTGAAVECPSAASATQAVFLVLTKPLPAANPRPKSGGTIQPWSAALSDGARCGVLTGTTPGRSFSCGLPGKNGSVTPIYCTWPAPEAGDPSVYSAKCATATFNGTGPHLGKDSTYTFASLWY